MALDPHPLARLREPVPDWSPTTRVALQALSIVERRFAEGVAGGLSAAESYRRATGKSGRTQALYQSAYRLRHRLDVAAAIKLCVEDVSVRHWAERLEMMQSLRWAISRAETTNRADGPLIV